MLLPLPLHIPVDTIRHPLLTNNSIDLHLLRLDTIDEDVSGNKIFKLYYFLQHAIGEHKGILTFGGAWSNHLAATAAACNFRGIASVGIVRGEEPKEPSDTITFCRQKGMELVFKARSDYAAKTASEFSDDLTLKYPNYIIIPEGGYSNEGVKGAALIHQYIKEAYTHVCCAVGTGTTFAGILSGNNKAEMIGFSALKGLADVEQRLNELLPDKKLKYTLQHEYHFGGFAKKTPELINFINQFYIENKIPLDFVYTGKMMFGIFDLIKNKYFTKGDKILAIHTGGLQGNRSLKRGELLF
ncbi:pyridoxal-phosphate dependent enzyme [soil metagenome]